MTEADYIHRARWWSWTDKVRQAWEEWLDAHDADIDDIAAFYVYEDHVVIVEHLKDEHGRLYAVTDGLGRESVARREVRIDASDYPSIPDRKGTRI